MNGGDSGNDFVEMLLGLIDVGTDSSDDNDEIVYRDRPLLFRASQLVRDEVMPENDTPAQLTEMREMSYSHEAQWKSKEWLFYKQGKFMEDYEDDYSGDAYFNAFYPTYSDMTLEQQRTYFAWRTNIRRGEYEDTSLSYIFVYAYELINLLGVESPMEAYDRLKTLLEKYGESQPKLKSYVSRWLEDMVIYYDLDRSLLKDSNMYLFHENMKILIKPEKYTSEELFDALAGASSYNVKRSAFYNSSPDDFREVAAASFIALNKYYTSRNTTAADRFFGKRVNSIYNMFSSAVFCHYRVSKHTSYEVNELCTFTFSNCYWFSRSYMHVDRKSKMLGDMLRAVDSMMREKCRYEKPLQMPDIMKLVYRTIDKESDKYLEHKKELEKTRIDIDLSKLSSIRRAADITRDKLIVDEEYDEPETVTEEAVQTPQDINENTSPLDDGEYAFMQALLYGGDFNSAAKNAGSMPSILSESINEKLYDEFADTVIGFEGDTPFIIEDYEEDLKGMILP